MRTFIEIQPALNFAEKEKLNQRYEWVLMQEARRGYNTHFKLGKTCSENNLMENFEWKKGH